MINNMQCNMNETIAHGHLFIVNLIDQMIGVLLNYDQYNVDVTILELTLRINFHNNHLGRTIPGQKLGIRHVEAYKYI